MVVVDVVVVLVLPLVSSASSSSSYGGSAAWRRCWASQAVASPGILPRSIGDFCMTWWPESKLLDFRPVRYVTTEVSLWAGRESCSMDSLLLCQLPAASLLSTDEEGLSMQKIGLRLPRCGGIMLRTQKPRDFRVGRLQWHFAHRQPVVGRRPTRVGTHPKSQRRPPESGLPNNLGYLSR